jgi:SAM-dependent methyltransferase
MPRNPAARNYPSVQHPVVAKIQAERWRTEVCTSLSSEGGRYDPAMRRIWPWPALLLEEVAGWIKGLPGNLWLDAACGDGHLGTLLRRQKRLLGLDLAWDRLRDAHAHPYLALIQASVDCLPLRSGSLDGIVSVETLEHTVDLDGVLGEFARCLRRHGHLVMTIPSVTLRSWWQMRVTRRPVYCDPKEHVREFSAVPLRGFPHMFETWESLEARARRNGFTMVRAGGVGFLLPMWRGWGAWAERGMNVLHRETINRWLGRLPVVRRFPYYRIASFQYTGRG